MDNYNQIRYLLIILILSSCSKPTTYQIDMYTECDDCNVNFIYPDNTIESFRLVDQAISNSLSLTDGQTRIRVIDNKGISYSEIRLNGEVVRSRQSYRDYAIEYDIRIGGRQTR
jgi:hypothetical protein